MERDVMGLVDQTHLDGLIVTAPLSESTTLIRALDRRSLPFVRVAPNDVEHQTPYVDMDDAGAAREMTEYLLGLGHRRIGFIIGHPDHFASGQRLVGYKAALAAHGIEFQERYTRQGYFTFESGMDAAKELLSQTDRPTAIFASNDDMAAGALMAAHELGLNVPEQLSVAGFDDTYIAKTVWPRLTTVHQPTYDLAYTATNLLLQLLQSGTVPQSMRLGYRLVCRASTAVAQK
jgi:LacI family transcriptional regulator